MKTDVKSVSEFLGGNMDPFFIPPFQRAYAWGTPELSRFFSDVEKLIAPANAHKHHFFGTLVIQREELNLSTGNYTNILIVDGQQRLTTSLILIMALRDTIVTDEQVMDHINNRYLTSLVSPYDHLLKLKQVTADWENYKALFKGDKLQNGAIKRAYSFFQRELRTLQREYAQNGYPLSFRDFESALGRMNLAVITLDTDPAKGEDPQVIFETLNSLGKPLTLADLIRNYILMGLPTKEQTAIYDQKFFPQIELLFTEKELPNYFRDFIQYKLATPMKVVDNGGGNSKAIYATFKDEVVPMYESPHELIDDLIAFAPLYKFIVDPNFEYQLSEDTGYNKSIKELLRHIFQDMKSDPFKSFVLGLLAHCQGVEQTAVLLSDTTLRDSLVAIRTYLVRRRLLGLNQGENKVTPLWSLSITDIAVGQKTMWDLLTQSSFVMRMPNDLEMKREWNTQTFEKSGYSRFVLRRIEQHLRPEATTSDEVSQLLVHKVMPQELTYQWKQDLGEDFERIHQEYLYDLGNLILVEPQLNLSNQSFYYKRRYMQGSHTSFKGDLEMYTKWDEQAMQMHRERMVQRFLDTFALPAELCTSNNWAETQEVQDNMNVVSPLNPFDQEVVTHRRPISMAIEGNSYLVSEWRNCPLILFRYIQEYYPDVFAEILENPKLSFRNGKRPFVFLGKDIPLYEDVSNFLTRHATLDGINLSEQNVADLLTEKELIINVNQSSSRYMKYMGEVAEVCHMSEEDIQIELMPL